MRRTTRVILAAAFVGGSALTGAAPAAAAVPAGYAFVFADQPTNQLPYAPNARASASSSGGVNVITRAGTGRYTVRLGGLGGATDGNVQVSAYGEDAARCKSDGWSVSGSDVAVGVRCHTVGGTATDAKFSLQFTRGTNDTAKQSAYLLGGGSTVEDSFNSRGGTNTVTRTGVGTWTVGFGTGFTRLGGIVHVTAVGTGGEHCKVQGWNTASAHVRCFGATGSLVDTRWSLRYTDQHLPNGFADLGGYVWSTATGAVDARHSFNMLLAENSVLHEGVGRYRARFERIPAFDAGNPMATAHGTANVSCKVNEHFSSGSSSVVDVECRDAAGVLTDSAFTVSQVTNL